MRLGRELYEQVEQNEKNTRRTLIIASVAVLFLASVLLFSAAIAEFQYEPKHLYVFGESEQMLAESLAYQNSVQYIDVNALASLCGAQCTAFFSQMSYSCNGTYLTVENGSDIATVNELDIELSAPARVVDGRALIPLSDAERIIYGIKVAVSESKTEITLSGEMIYMIANEANVSYETDVSAFLQYIHSKDKYIFTLANKQTPLGKDFPEDKDLLLEIPEEYRKSSVIYLWHDALGALKAMMQDMIACGIDDTYVTSAYRSYAYQEMLFDMYLDQEMNSGLSYDEAREKVLTYSALPGTSEHQTGLCVDFTTKAIGGVVDDVFETTPAFDWLIKNSWKYGFVLRYPSDKVDITGYSYESWHYRFVGFEVASIMHQTGLCYEEYLNYFKQMENDV